MGRYLVFGFDAFYPSGGMEDLRSVFPHEADAVAYAVAGAPADDHVCEYTQVVDLVDRTIRHFRDGVLHDVASF